MTLNLLWSDRSASYIVVDSARSHPGMPRRPYSMLGQLQRREERGVSVEEGAQKIIPLGPSAVAGLCGNEGDCLEFVRRLRSSLQHLDLSALLAHVDALADPAHFDIAVAIAGDEPPFNVYRFPKREIFEVYRTHVHVSGSMSDEPKGFLAAAVRRFLVDNDPPIDPVLKLIAGLAFATTTSVHHDLTRDHVGGTFFGASLHDGRLTWQPDVLYVLYPPGFSEGSVTVPTPDDPIDLASVAEARFDLIACRVRDDVGFAVSTISRCGAAFWPDLSNQDVERWIEKWADSLSSSLFDNTAYVAFVPKVPGQVVVLPNDGRHFRMGAGRIALSDVLAAKLRSRHDGNRFGFTVLLSD